MLLLILLGALPSFSVRLVSVAPVLVERWEALPIPFHLQLAGSDDLGPASLIAVRAAFSTWATVDCANITFAELGDAPDPNTNLAAGGKKNGLNEVHWLEDSSWRFGSSVLGVTVPILAPDGRLVEADIAFNGLQIQWTSSGNGGTDLEAVALHEIGHFLGIQHNLGPFFHEDQPVMAPYIAGGVVGRTLTDDDRAAACFLYPRETWTCASDADCPLLLSQTFESDDFYSGRLRCDDGTCSRLERYVPGQVGLGESCHRPEECRSGLICHPFGESGVCTHACDPRAPSLADSCENGFDCEPFPPPLDREGVCLPSSGEVYAPGEGPEGCLDAWICSEGRFCMPTPLDPALKRCAALCTATSPDCPGDTRCYVYAGTGGACFPPELLPQPEPEPEPEPAPEPEPGPEVTELEAEPGPDTESDAGPTEEPTPRKKDTGCHGTGPLTPLLAIAALALTRPFWSRHGRPRSAGRSLPANLRLR